jgi:hypothetical protein
MTLPRPVRVVGADSTRKIRTCLSVLAYWNDTYLKLRAPLAADRSRAAKPTVVRRRVTSRLKALEHARRAAAAQDCAQGASPTHHWAHDARSA